MARLGYEHTVDVEATEAGDFSLMPDMVAAMEASSIELEGTKDGDPDGLQAKIVFDIIEPEEFKGRKIWAYWTINHSDHENGSFKFGKRMFDSFCRSVHVLAPEDTDDLVLKQFPARIGTKVGGDKKDKATGKVIGTYDDKNDIKEFYYTDDDAKKPVPEIGVIASGKTGAKATVTRAQAPANDNRAAAPAKAAGAKPWGAPKK